MRTCLTKVVPRINTGVVVLLLSISWGGLEDPVSGQDQAAGPQVRNTADEGPSARESLECPEGDLEQIAISDFGEDAPGGPTTPDEAIEEVVSQNYPGFAPTNFTLEKADSDSASYVYEADGRLLGTLHAMKIRDSWYVGALEICSSQLADQS